MNKLKAITIIQKEISNCEVGEELHLDIGGLILIKHKEFDMIAFIGSTHTTKGIKSAIKRMKDKVLHTRRWIELFRNKDE